MRSPEDVGNVVGTSISQFSVLSSEVFSVALDSPNFEHMASIRFWIAADPVTTVEVCPLHAKPC